MTQIDITKNYKVEKYTKKTDWTDCGILSGADVKAMIKTFTIDKTIYELCGDMVFSRKNSTTMIMVTEA